MLDAGCWMLDAGCWNTAYQALYHKSRNFALENLRAYNFSRAELMKIAKRNQRVVLSL